MASQSPVRDPAPTQGPLVPPEEQFWQRYSPHNEFPLSSFSSVTIFVLALVGLFFASTFIDFGHREKPIDLGGSIDLIPGGGPGGPGSGTGNGKKESVAKSDPIPSAPTVPLEKIERTNLEPTAFKDIIPPDSDSVRYISKGNLAAKSLSNIRDNARRDLMSGLGKGGPGTGGPGTGGPGKGDLTNRQKRVLRWTMIFDTSNGNDYLNQLHSMGAILGIPGRDGKYRIIRNLRQRPARPQLEDVTKIQRIFWIDDRPASVGPLMRALRLQPVPHVIAFFPASLEKECLRKELAFRRRPEHEILETRFRVTRRGNSFTPVVIDQR